MSNNPKYKMSEETLAELKEELAFLENVRAKEVAEQIKEARSFGDLSENSEFEEAKTEHGKLGLKIAELKDLVENAEIVQATEQTDRVGMGSKVTVRDLEYETQDVYEIVGSQEADPVIGKISDDSPFGRELMDKQIGDSVEVEAPAGIQKFEIIDIA